MSSGRAVRLTRLCLISPDAARLAQFYQDACGCRVVASEMLTEATATRLAGVRGAAHSVLLRLGAQQLQLLQPVALGRGYPPGVSACDLRFQHFAIVVEDMQRAYAHLRQVAGWAAISTHGPQRLPASSGGVTAFKFRDPDGHPLELLEFPASPSAPVAVPARAAMLFRGIDHSAIVVADSSRSIAFYENLGLQVSARSINQGPEQQRLDGLEEVRVEVTALSTAQAPPHLELLCYRAPAPGTGQAGRSTVGAAHGHSNDVAATRLVFAGERPGAAPRQLIDPDGHRLMVC